MTNTGGYRIIESEAKDACNTLLPLTKSPVKEVIMATRSLPSFPLTPQLLKRAAIFWSRVNITADPNECWEWTGPKTKHYGSFYFANKTTTRTHRLSLWLTSRSPLIAEIVLHSCDNPPCCNPNHLKAGTAKDNALDAYSKGRLGGFPYCKKLSLEQAREIRSAISNGATIRETARNYNVSASTIRGIVRFEWFKDDLDLPEGDEDEK